MGVEGPARERERPEERSLYASGLKEHSGCTNSRDQSLAYGKREFISPGCSDPGLDHHVYTCGGEGGRGEEMESSC